MARFIMALDQAVIFLVRLIRHQVTQLIRSIAMQLNGKRVKFVGTSMTYCMRPKDSLSCELIQAAR